MEAACFQIWSLWCGQGQFFVFFTAHCCDWFIVPLLSYNLLFSFFFRLSFFSFFNWDLHHLSAMLFVFSTDISDSISNRFLTVIDNFSLRTRAFLHIGLFVIFHCISISDLPIFSDYYSPPSQSSTGMTICCLLPKIYHLKSQMWPVYFLIPAIHASISVTLFHQFFVLHVWSLLCLYIFPTIDL